jgi:hypothetical protein
MELHSRGDTDSMHRRDFMKSVTGAGLLASSEVNPAGTSLSGPVAARCLSSNGLQCACSLILTCWLRRFLCVLNLRYNRDLPVRY